MSQRLKNLNKKYYIALGIGIALIFLIIFIFFTILFIPHIYRLDPFVGIRVLCAIVALFLLIIALAKIFRKTFTTNVYRTITIIMLLIGAIIATSINLHFENNFLNIIVIVVCVIVIVVCVVVLLYTLTLKKREEQRSQEEISPQHKIAQEEISPLHKIAQREYYIPMILFAVGGTLMVIGIVVAIFFVVSGLGGLEVDPGKLNNLGGYILLGILVGPPIIFLIVPGYFLVRLAYKKYEISKQ